jgi:hypothetical protein
VLAGWALWQRLAQGSSRSQALFETPATLSAILNLVLAPALVWFVCIAGPRRLLVLPLLVLVAASAVAGSRGGWVALGGAGAIAWVLAARARLQIDRRIAIGVVVTFALACLGATALPIDAPQGSVTGGLDTASTVSRFDLYRLAFHAITPGSLVLGSGYLSFYYFLEPAREAVAGYSSSITYFVHNDYLQTLLELGVPGLASLLGVAVLPQVCAWRAAAARGESGLLAVALAAGIGSMTIHAIVDFPFYVPVCLLLYGVAAGLLDSLSPTRAAIRAPRVLTITFGALAFWLLITPVAAQAAAGYAHRQWQRARGESAAYWFEVARRIDSRDWRYHWYAGQFWYAQALEARKPEAARLADAAFAAGSEANPREVRNLLGRISVQARLRPLLADPADARTLRAWCDHALKLAPLNQQVRVETEFAQKQLGRGTGESPQ